MRGYACLACRANGEGTYKQQGCTARVNTARVNTAGTQCKGQQQSVTLGMKEVMGMSAARKIASRVM